MEDYEIIALYRQRSETAIAETEQKYGAAIRAIAQNLLGNAADAEECLNDTLSTAWDSIPPACPENLKYWLFRVARNKAMAAWRHGHFQKRWKRCSPSLRSAFLPLKIRRRPWKRPSFRKRSPPGSKRLPRRTGTSLRAGIISENPSPTSQKAKTFARKRSRNDFIACVRH